MYNSKTLNCIEQFLNLVSAVTRCISISAFACLFGIPIETTSSAMGLKICTVNAAIKKYKSIIEKKKNKPNKTVLLGKTKLSGIKVLISKSLINSYISHDEFGLVKTVLKKYDDTEKEINSLNSSSKILVYL